MSIEPTRTPSPHPVEPPTGWGKFTASLAWLFEKIFAPIKLLYTTATSWHWKATKRASTPEDEVARGILERGSNPAALPQENLTRQEQEPLQFRQRRPLQHQISQASHLVFLKT